MGSGGMFPGLASGESIIVNKRIMEDATKRYGFLSYSVQPKVVVEEVEEVIEVAEVEPEVIEEVKPKAKAKTKKSKTKK